MTSYENEIKFTDRHRGSNNTHATVISGRAAHTQHRTHCGGAVELTVATILADAAVTPTVSEMTYNVSWDVKPYSTNQLALGVASPPPWTHSGYAYESCSVPEVYRGTLHAEPREPAPGLLNINCSFYCR